MAQPSDCNLLLGILALQNDFVTRDQLIEAMNAWVLAKHRPLRDLLRERAALDGEELALLEALVARQLARHEDNVEQSLRALPVSSSLRDLLASVADPDVRAACNSLSSAPSVATDDYVPCPGADGVRYRILRPHAKGGLGEVFIAEDSELHREVALKEIQARHAHDERSRGRFLLEAEITGRLEHPGIVPVYGLGTYDDGRPFYAMRFIRGDNLKHAIEQFQATRERFNSLTFRRLLGRFLDVCNAVAYAHSRGVLHRDLKPGNVMLGEFGETLVVDWGLAKVVGRRDPARTASENTLRPSSGSELGVETVAGTALGTPAFMSPEQAEGKLDQLGPVTDVYSLGATLYSLLTGLPPVPKGEEAEMLERVRRGDIAPPCTVRPDVPKALEAICRKAMTLRPADRYPSALALAADVEHWLADEPVTACREPLLVRAGRWARKHKPVVATAAAVLLTTTIGLAVGLFFVEAEKNRTERARQGEEAQRLEAERNAKEAQEREVEIRAVLDFVENKVFAAARPEGQEGGLGRAVTLRRAVESALPFVDKSFANQPLIEARLRMTLGSSFWYLGEAKTAAEQYHATRALYARHRGPNHHDTLMSMNNLANSYAALGRHADALKLYEEVLFLQKAKLDPDHPDTLLSMNNLANCYEALGRHADALKLRDETLTLKKAKLGPDHPDTLKSMNNLANSYAALGRYAEALKLDEETLALRKAKLGPEHPHTLSSMNNLSGSYYALGRHDDALRLREATLALQKAKLDPDHPDTLRTMNNLANSYEALGRHGDALNLREETLSLQKAKLGPDHPDTLTSMNNMAESYAALGRNGDALKLREETLALRQAKLGPDHPNTLRSMSVVAESLVQLGRGTEAVPIIDDCLKRAAGQVVNPQLLQTVMELRLRHFEKSKDAAGCLATAELWEQLHRSDADSLYLAACMRAVTTAVARATDKSEGAGKTATSQADRAMVWLKQAVGSGYKKAANVKKDKDLDALRDRGDFKKLLAELELNMEPDKK